MEVATIDRASDRLTREAIVFVCTERGADSKALCWHAHLEKGRKDIEHAHAVRVAG